MSKQELINMMGPEKGLKMWNKAMGIKPGSPEPKKAKFHNKKVVTEDGIKFDSKKEERRYYELLQMKKAGLIASIQLQPKFVLQEAFRDKTGYKHRAITYVADFLVVHNSGLEEVEDVKPVGRFTAGASTYSIKKKLFIKLYPQYKFTEVR